MASYSSNCVEALDTFIKKNIVHIKNCLYRMMFIIKSNSLESIFNVNSSKYEIWITYK